VIGRLKRVSEREWDFLDRVLAAAAFLAMALDVAFGHWPGPHALEFFVVAVIAAAFIWRRKRPLMTAAVVVAGSGGLLIAFKSPAHGGPVTFMVMFAAYATGAHLPLRRSLVGLVLTLGAIVAVCVVRTPNDIFFPVIFFGAVPWVVGRLIRNQTALARELTEKAEREQIAREEEEARATAAERARVAREIHDVLAHNLSVMVIQAAAARRIADKDPGAAVKAAELISRTGREALSELRYVFGPVRKQEGDVLGASPGLANVDQLASRAHRAGLLVKVHVKGEPVELSPGANLAAYRVVQEALTNTLKHARGSQATVTVRYEPRDVVVEVVDDGARGGTANGNAEDSGGHGLVGMRERVALYGGDLEIGRHSNGGFAVRARLPTGATPA
jgi:signal transduction histidine kinase